MFDVQESTDRLSVKLSGELTIQQAEHFKAELMNTLARGKDMTLDLAAVSELDSAGVQLLYFAKQAAREQGVGFELQQHSPAVIEVFELYRLAPIFGDPMILDAQNDNHSDTGTNGKRTKTSAGAKP